MGATRAHLLRILRSVDLVGWSSHEESGKLDRKALTRFATGSTTVFKRRESKEADTSAVSVLIDCSFSMNNNGRIKVAHGVAIQLSRIFDKANINFAVTGFKGSSTTQIARQRETGAECRTDGEDTILIPFKAWGESMRSASSKLGSISNCAGSATPDYSALMLSIEDLAKQRETRKILFVLTDAEGFISEHIKHVQNVAEQQGITTVAIGIGSEDVKEVFENASTANDLRDLGSVSFNTLLKTLRR
jgi:cobalamin biosynthesis protein CobT